MKLTVICVRCGAFREFYSSDREGCEVEAAIGGWQLLIGDTFGQRNGRCPAHAIARPT